MKVGVKTLKESKKRGHFFRLAQLQAILPVKTWQAIKLIKHKKAI